MTQWLRRILRQDSGQDLSEYALLVALIALLACTALLALGASLNLTYGDVSTTLSGSAAGGGSGPV